MKIDIQITPKFDLIKVVDETVRKEWFQLQAGVIELGIRAHEYMIHYIKTHKKRPKAGVGMLEKSIKVKTLIDQAQVGWGVGHMPTMTRLAPHWRVINYGSTHIQGMKIPGYFDTGAPDRAKRGKGRDAFHYEKGKFIMTPNFGIPPMNYIQWTKWFAERELLAMIATLKATNGRGII